MSAGALVAGPGAQLGIAAGEGVAGEEGEGAEGVFKVAVALGGLKVDLGDALRFPVAPYFRIEDLPMGPVGQEGPANSLLCAVANQLPGFPIAERHAQALGLNDDLGLAGSEEVIDDLAGDGQARLPPDVVEALVAQHLDDGVDRVPTSLRLVETLALPAGKDSVEDFGGGGDQGGGVHGGMLAQRRPTSTRRAPGRTPRCRCSDRRPRGCPSRCCDRRPRPRRGRRAR